MGRWDLQIRVRTGLGNVPGRLLGFKEEISSCHVPRFNKTEPNKHWGRERWPQAKTCILDNNGKEEKALEQEQHLGGSLLISYTHTSIWSSYRSRGSHQLQPYKEASRLCQPPSPCVESQKERWSATVKQEKTLWTMNWRIWSMWGLLLERGSQASSDWQLCPPWWTTDSYHIPVST